MVKRPRSRKQLRQAETPLALEERRPIQVVALRCQVGVERVERWIAGFEDKR
jgi:hypothetical protein